MSKPVGEQADSGSATGPVNWTGLLEHYRQTAVSVLASHLCVGTTCASCGQPWPCRAACAAELALEL